jgi:8-oxo-dGTP diphosphatase
MQQVIETLIVAAGVIVEQGKILITQRKEEDAYGLLWEFPGGKVKQGEEPRQALRRELREELGIEAYAGVILDAVFQIYPEYPILLLAYHCRIEKGAPAPLDCHDLRWVNLEELNQFPMPPADHPIRNRLLISD